MVNDGFMAELLRPTMPPKVSVAPPVEVVVTTGSSCGLISAPGESRTTAMLSKMVEPRDVPMMRPPVVERPSLRPWIEVSRVKGIGNAPHADLRLLGEP